MNSEAEYTIVASVLKSDKQLRVGDKCWLAGGTGGEGWHRFEWVRNKGRKIRKWAPTLRFHNFRAAWIPEHMRERVWYITGTREEMETRAKELESFAEAERAAHPNRAARSIPLEGVKT